MGQRGGAEMKSEKLNYSALIDTISKVHKQAQSGAAGTVNRFLILRNWLIGAYIIEYEQKGKDRAEYGESCCHAYPLIYKSGT